MKIKEILTVTWKILKIFSILGNKKELQDKMEKVEKNIK